MITTSTTGSQFIALDFRLLDNPRFRVFMRSRSFPFYLILRRYIWRSRGKHPVAKVSELHKQGYLVCAMSRDFLAEKFAIRDSSHVSRYLADLEKRGVLRKVRTGRQNVYVLGTWEGRGKHIVETFFAEACFLDVSKTATSDVSRTTTSDVSKTATSDVAESATSDVPKTPPYNKEVNKEKNREEKSPHGLPRFPDPQIPISDGPGGSGRAVEIESEESNYVPIYEPLYVRF